MAAAPANKISPIGEHPKTRKDQAKGYYFILPDWLAARLCQERATGAMWAVTTCVGRMTRFSHTPIIISLSQFEADIHYAKQSISDAIARLVGAGLLYEEIEANGQQRRYALINVTVPACQTADSKPALALLGDGDVIYPLPDAGVLKSRTVNESYFKRKRSPKIEEGTVLKSRSLPPKIEEGRVLESRTPVAHQPAPGHASATALNYEDKRKITKNNTPNGVAATAAPSDVQFAKNSTQKQDTRVFQQTKSRGNTTRSENRDFPPAQQLRGADQPALFPAVAVAPPSQPVDAVQQKSRSSRRWSRPTSERKVPPQNMLYEVWKVIKPPATERQQKSIIIGLAELSNTEKTMGHPVTPVELPGLMYQTMSWTDRRTGKNYTPSPWKIAGWLSDLRDEVRDYPCPRVRAWLNWQVQQAEEAPGAADDLAHLIEIVRAFEAYLRGDPDADPSVAEEAEEEARVAREREIADCEQTDEILSADEVEDFSWTARLRRHVPDPDGARHGRHEQEVRILWGFVRDELRPGLNTARRQHLDALTAAWDPEQPYALLLLSSSGYAVDFIGAALMREINARVEKLLSRFFESAKVMMVPQSVIDALRESIQAEEELISTAQ